MDNGKISEQCVGCRDVMEAIIKHDRTMGTAHQHNETDRDGDRPGDRDWAGEEK